MTTSAAGVIVVDTLEDATDRRLVVHRSINAPAERLFQACTVPSRLSEWWGLQPLPNLGSETLALC